jgi:hydrogenase expression/formation protein HypC
VLVFLEAAREHISPERAAEVNAVLDLVAHSMVGATLSPEALDDPGFSLPSAMSAEQLRALAGVPKEVRHD